MGKHVEKLSDVQIRKWVKASNPVAKADGAGLTFTLSAGGTAAWVLRYRFGGKPREMTLGRYPDKSLAQARDDARRTRASIQDGIDVAREKRIAGIERAEAKSFRQLATDYMEKAFPDLAANTIKQRHQHIEGVILPKLGGLAVRDVTTANVVALVENAPSPQYFLYAYVKCNAMLERELGHSGIHGACPHRIKVCVLKKNNEPVVFAALASLAGPKPKTGKRRSQTFWQWLNRKETLARPDAVSKIGQTLVATGKRPRRNSFEAWKRLLGALKGTRHYEELTLLWAEYGKARQPRKAV